MVTGNDYLAQMSLKFVRYYSEAREIPISRNRSQDGHVENIMLPLRHRLRMRITRELKSARGRMMPPPLHLSDIHLVNASSPGVPMASKLCTLKFVNSFARRQHLFHIAATAINVDSSDDV